MSDQTKSDDAGNASSPEVVKALEDKIAKLESQVQGTEKLLQKWGNEQGSSRKAIESTVNELKKIMDEKNPKDLVDKLKEIEETISTFKNGKGNQTEKEADVEATLSDEEREAVDKTFQGLDETTRYKIASSPEEKRKFLLAYKEGNPVVPTSLFQKKSTEKSSTGDNEYRRIWNKEDKSSNYMPSAVKGSSKGFAGGAKANQPTISKQLIGGIIPRPEGVKL